MRIPLIVSVLFISAINSSLALAKKHPKERDVCAGPIILYNDTAPQICPNLCVTALGNNWVWNGNWAMNNDAMPPALITCLPDSVNWLNAGVCGCKENS